VYVNSKRAGIAAPITQARVVNYKRGVQGCTDDTVKTRAEFRDNYMSLHLVELEMNDGPPVRCDCKGFWVLKARALPVRRLRACCLLAGRAPAFLARERCVRGAGEDPESSASHACRIGVRPPASRQARAESH
jgi:hypothetical protein